MINNVQQLGKIFSRIENDNKKIVDRTMLKGERNRGKREMLVYPNHNKTYITNVGFLGYNNKNENIDQTTCTPSVVVSNIVTSGVFDCTSTELGTVTVNNDGIPSSGVKSTAKTMPRVSVQILNAYNFF